MGHLLKVKILQKSWICACDTAMTMHTLTEIYSLVSTPSSSPSLNVRCSELRELQDGAMVWECGRDGCGCTGRIVTAPRETSWGYLGTRVCNLPHTLHAYI